ncbi:hypothetical protein GCM10010140_05930 [Streptosporangium pseudovulgare]|uniref:Uncharacterized protein n=1 Tax=Streptosporangium pseudovulgare TaxID=35765 RepID=A0ABQ2QFV7_9ACTN|nr:hypothetical protein GCM10010140_05930 [Streptosporangium pseudovulgare]
MMMRSAVCRNTCPRCGSPLDEGPVVYRCACCGRSVYAADVNTEFRRPAPPPAPVSVPLPAPVPVPAPVPAPA